MKYLILLLMLVGCSTRAVSPHFHMGQHVKLNLSKYPFIELVCPKAGIVRRYNEEGVFNPSPECSEKGLVVEEDDLIRWNE